MSQAHAVGHACWNGHQSTATRLCIRLGDIVGKLRYHNCYSHTTVQPHLMCAVCHTGSVHKAPPSDPHYLHHLQQCLMQQQEQVDNTRLQV